MPVRKIPKNHLVVTGGFASLKAERMVGFESLLEKEHMLLLDFDPDVLDYEEQPVRIPVPRVSQGYVVDLKVRYRKRPTELVEVKPQYYLDKHASKYAPKFEAARSYCADHGMVFVIKTDLDIRTPRLANLKFLRRYRNLELDPSQRTAVLQTMEDSDGHATSEGLLSQLGPHCREDWLPVIWHMVLNGDLFANLDSPLPPDVPLQLQEAHP